MRIVIQRVSRASVTVDGETVGKIGKGFLLLIGAADTDTEEIVDKMIAKVGKLRIFEDENGKTNLSLKDVGGEILAVSQFTLYADCRKGNRPNGSDALDKMICICSFVGAFLFDVFSPFGSLTADTGLYLICPSMIA